MTRARGSRSHGAERTQGAHPCASYQRRARGWRGLKGRGWRVMAMAALVAATEASDFKGKEGAGLHSEGSTRWGGVGSVHAFGVDEQPQQPTLKEVRQWTWSSGASMVDVRGGNVVTIGHLASPRHMSAADGMDGVGAGPDVDIGVVRRYREVGLGT
uniref:Uncharacterized protein n=1 Tax=Oryza punctata TaxID=4537 RepID=A0A0E0L1D9_ORYPU